MQVTNKRRIVVIAALVGVAALAAAARNRIVNIDNPVILTREECLAPYVAAAKDHGSVGSDVIATLEHNGCIKHLVGAYEVELDPETKPDPNFAHATLRLNVAEMRRRDPNYQDTDINRTPPVETGYVFRAQIRKQGAASKAVNMPPGD